MTGSGRKWDGLGELELQSVPIVGLAGSVGARGLEWLFKDFLGEVEGAESSYSNTDV